jgi:hypothetical protein
VNDDRQNHRIAVEYQCSRVEEFELVDRQDMLEVDSTDGRCLNLSGENRIFDARL